MTMQVDKARLDEMLGVLPESSTSYFPSMNAIGCTAGNLRSIITELLELRSLRSTEGKEVEELASKNSVLIADGIAARKAAASNFSRAEAAEAHVAKLRDALEPFAALYVESMRDFPDGSSKTERPDDKQAWGFNNVDLTWGDFRRSAALTRSPE